MNIDDLLPLLRVPGPLNPGTLDFAKFLKKSSDVYKQTSSETSDAEIIEKSTGTTSEQSSPENQTIVKTNSGNKSTVEDSTDVPVLVHRTDYGDTLRIKRRHKGTKHGRFISEPYFKPFK